ncbi:hypothetical protein TNCV_3694551 [Trichonephila clavipes]|nr:hypothetical protein TNCV_3694551 [Trichonephila clavipes]
MLPTFSRKPKIMPFWTSDNSLHVCITPTTVVFSEALTHPLYTLNSTAMPASFCDWLFNVKVGPSVIGYLTSKSEVRGGHINVTGLCIKLRFEIWYAGSLHGVELSQERILQRSNSKGR